MSASRQVAAECFFLDVGQGTSNVVLLGDKRAIVIDCGSFQHAPVLLSLLRRYVDRIVALIVSHNDRDHDGGATVVINAYPNAIDRLYFLQDRPVEKLRLYSVVQDALRNGRLVNLPIRLECDDRPRIIYQDQAADLSLEVLFPGLIDSMDAQKRRRPNATSGVLALFCGRRKIVFAGDSTIDNWRAIRDRLGAQLTPDILAVPHHGGDVVGKRQQKEPIEDYAHRVDENLKWLYQEAICPRCAIISTGTCNSYGHPHPATIRALRNSGATVLCTQITGQCHECLEGLRPGVIPPTTPSASRRHEDLTHGRHSRNLACASTVVSEISSESIVIQRLVEHQLGVDALATMPQGKPLCRVDTG